MWLLCRWGKRMHSNGLGGAVRARIPRAERSEGGGRNADFGRFGAGSDSRGPRKASKQGSTRTAHTCQSLPNLCHSRPSSMTMSSLEPLSHQVAGHPDGVQSLEGGRLVVKACLPRELRFYQQVQQAVQTSQTRQTELLSRLLQFMPRCHGSWQDYAGSTATTADSEPEPRIVLGEPNVRYTRPNVCDLKLGTQLWDEEASDEKRARMDRAAASTTSGSHGVRLTGGRRTIPRRGSSTACPRRLARPSAPNTSSWACVCC